MTCHQERDIQSSLKQSRLLGDLRQFAVVPMLPLPGVGHLVPWMEAVTLWEQLQSRNQLKLRKDRFYRSQILSPFEFLLNRLKHRGVGTSNLFRTWSKELIGEQGGEQVADKA